MDQELIETHMRTAFNYASRSKAVRRKVGCIIVKDDRIISIGYNGTPKKWDNVCEHTVDGKLVTKPEVLHAELNALVKVARSTESSDGAVMFVTCAPCFDCAKLVAEAGIVGVYYSEIYHDTRGIDHLVRRGVLVEQVTI